MIEHIRLDSAAGMGGTEEGDTPGLRVIVVDDHPSYAHGIATLLNALGGIKVVAVAHEAEVAGDVAAEHRPDVVLMDIRFPERSGIEATRKIRATLPEVKVAILTASNDPTDREEAMEAGACGYLLKQWDAGRLVAGIKAIALGETVVAPLSTLDAGESPTATDPLTEDDVVLLRLLSRGLDLAAVARNMGISASTVKRQIVQVQRKLGAGNRIEAVVTAAKQGLL